MGEGVAAFWCRTPSRPNFGDALTPWLLEKLTGHHPRFTWPNDPREKLFVTGSIATLAASACTVWGAGIMNADDVISPEARLLAVRGPLTRARALASGASCLEVYGDPALLLPRLHRPPSASRRGIGLAAHFSDRPRLLGKLPPSVHLIDMQAPVESVIEQIACCELVAASSLHGLITSHAYGIPAVWVQFRPLPSGDGAKFRDYLLAVDRARDAPLELTPNELEANTLVRHAISPPTSFDLMPLIRACPVGVHALEHAT
ncbi:MAG: polysaccharide pyruvyl transferase family protein [Planctomycetes bacterium]|nr:polysaccharide pyruvyl transferase family protein [Planctomycetota bacterium]